MSKSESILLKMEARFKSFASLTEDISSFPMAAHLDSQVKTNKEKSKEHGEVFTPLWLVDEMIGQVKWDESKTQTLDLCAGWGQFSIRLARHFYNTQPDFDIDTFIANHSFSELQLSSCYKLLLIFSLKINLFIGDSTHLGRLPEGARGIWVYVESAGYWVCLTKTIHNIFFDGKKPKKVSEEEFVSTIESITVALNKAYEGMRVKMSASLDSMKKSEKNRLEFLSVLNNATKDTSLQSVDTPPSIVSEMLDLVEEIESKSILVLFNCEIIEQLIHKKKVPVENITFGYDSGSALEAKAVEKIYGVKTAKWIETAEISVPLKYLKDKIVGNTYIVSDVFGGKKFDVVLSNPPYNDHLHLKILNELLGKATEETSIAKEYVVVHPANWLIDYKGSFQTFVSFKSLVNNKIKYINVFNGNLVFNIDLFYPCMITHIDVTYNGDISVSYFNDIFNVKNISDITKYGKNWDGMVFPFVKKIKDIINQTGNVWSFNKKQIDTSKFHCQLAAIVGNHSKDRSLLTKDDFYTMVQKNSEANKGIRKDMDKRPGPTFEFNSELELNNFINYLKTDFARFCLSLYKMSGNIFYGEMELIPWLDFNQSWDDEKLFKHFDVNQDTQEYIRKFLPDYYSIRK